MFLHTLGDFQDLDFIPEPETYCVRTVHVFIFCPISSKFVSNSFILLPFFQAYEVAHPSHTTAKNHYYCFMQGKFHVPVSLYGMISANNFLLVLNSSVNFIIYCLVEESFRAELLSILTSWFLGLWKIISMLYHFVSPSYHR